MTRMGLSLFSIYPALRRSAANQRQREGAYETFRSQGRKVKLARVKSL